MSARQPESPDYGTEHTGNDKRNSIQRYHPFGYHPLYDDMCSLV